MSEEIRQAATTVLSTVFETMLYMSVDLRDPEPEAALFPLMAPALLRSEIGFQGRYHGKICLHLSPDLGRSMAVNFLGLEREEVSESDAVDTVNEVCNMICGNLLSRLERKTPSIPTIPKTRLASIGEVQEDLRNCEIVIDFDAEGHGLKFLLHLEERKASPGAGASN
jgi:CheY-specific phosphatase CheX